MTKTDTELREWRATLDKVTPGPWIKDDTEHPEGYLILRKGVAWVGRVYTTNLAIHVARCDPQTIGELIDEVLSYRGGMLKLAGERTQIIRNAALDEAAGIALQYAKNPATVKAAILALKTPEAP